MTTLINHHETAVNITHDVNSAFSGVDFENGWKYTGEYFREEGITWFIVAKNNVTRATNTSPTYSQRG